MQTEPTEPANESTVETAELSPEDAEIARRDKKFNITEFDIEDTTEIFPIVRSNGQIDPGWHFIGKGIHPDTGREVGKFSKLTTGEDGRQINNYNYRDLAEQYALRSQEAEKARRKRAERLLSGPVVESLVDVNEVSDDSEYAYLKEWLPPVVRPDVPKRSGGYDYLFDPNYDPSKVTRAPETPEEKLAKYYDKFVTDENRAGSAEVLKLALLKNRELYDILRNAGIDPHSIESVDAIRENPDVRFEVAKYLAEKLDRETAIYPEEYGERVVNNQSNNQKVDSQTGERMPSRVYAVSVALKMLGGEWSEGHEANDFERNEQGRPIIGQHRHAARSLLLG